MLHTRKLTRPELYPEGENVSADAAFMNAFGKCDRDGRRFVDWQSCYDFRVSDDTLPSSWLAAVSLTELSSMK